MNKRRAENIRCTSGSRYSSLCEMFLSVFTPCVYDFGALGEGIPPLLLIISFIITRYVHVSLLFPPGLISWTYEHTYILSIHSYPLIKEDCGEEERSDSEGGLFWDVTANSQQKTTKKLDSAIIKPWNVRLISLSPFFRFHRNPPAPWYRYWIYSHALHHSQLSYCPHHSLSSLPKRWGRRIWSASKLMPFSSGRSEISNVIIRWWWEIRRRKPNMDRDWGRSRWGTPIYSRGEDMEDGDTRLIQGKGPAPQRTWRQEGTFLIRFSHTGWCLWISLGCVGKLYLSPASWVNLFSKITKPSCRCISADPH